MRVFGDDGCIRAVNPVGCKIRSVAACPSKLDTILESAIKKQSDALRRIPDAYSVIEYNLRGLVRGCVAERAGDHPVFKFQFGWNYEIEFIDTVIGDRIPG